VHVGEIAVEHHDVIVDDRGPLKRACAVEGDIDRHPLAAQAARDRFGQLFVILDDEYSHVVDGLRAAI
jgi:hypothetical protein